MQKEKGAEEVLEEFLMDWRIEDFSSYYTAKRAIETLESAGFKIVRSDDHR